MWSESKQVVGEAWILFSKSPFLSDIRAVGCPFSLSLCRLSGNSLTVLTGNRTCNHHTQPGVHCDFDSCAFKLFCVLVLSISGGSSDFNEKKIY